MNNKVVRLLVRKLTEKQRKFADNIILGKSQYESYITAYPSSIRWKRKAVDNKASELIKKDNVINYINEFNDEYEKTRKQELQYDRDKLLIDFMYLKDKSKESIEIVGVKQANSSAYTNALKNIGDLLGLYPDKKQNINLNGDLKTTNTNPYANLTEEELKKLINNDK